jgi:hypothetical protein
MLDGSGTRATFAVILALPGALDTVTILLCGPNGSIVNPMCVYSKPGGFGGKANARNGPPPKKFELVPPPGPACQLYVNVRAMGDDSVTDRARFRTDQFTFALVGNLKPAPVGTDSMVPSPTGLTVSPTKSVVSTPLKLSVRVLVPDDNVTELVPDPAHAIELGHVKIPCVVNAVSTTRRPVG